MVLRFIFSSPVVSYVSLFQSQNGYAIDWRQKKKLWRLVGNIVGYTRVFRSGSDPGILLKFFIFIDLRCFDCNANMIFVLFLFLRLLLFYIAFL